MKLHAANSNSQSCQPLQKNTNPILTITRILVKALQDHFPSQVDSDFPPPQEPPWGDSIVEVDKGVPPYALVYRLILFNFRAFG